MGLDLDKIVSAPVMTQFSETVTYAPLASVPARAAFITRGIFDEDPDTLFEAIPASEDKAAGHISVDPELGVRTAELALEPKKGDRVTIRGVLYEVWAVKRDGDGWRTLMLRKRI